MPAFHRLQCALHVQLAAPKLLTHVSPPPPLCLAHKRTQRRAPCNLRARAAGKPGKEGTRTLESAASPPAVSSSNGSGHDAAAGGSKPHAPPQQAVVSATAAAGQAPPSPGRAYRDGQAGRGGEPVKEESRKYRRTVYDHESWRQHRSTSRYLRHAKGMVGSRMVRGLASPLLYFFAISMAIAIWNTLVETGVAPKLLPELHMSNNGPFGITSFALSLLLVFRTNASYARWLDARRAWGLLLNRSRDITRQALTYFPPADRPLLDMLSRWIAAYSRSLMCHLRSDGDLELELRKVLREHEVQAVLLAQHKPNYCLQVVSEIVGSAHLPVLAPLAPPDAAAADGRLGLLPAVRSAAIYNRMDENLTAMEDILGTCERILKAPIPLSYTRHTSRFMMIWLTLLPFTLWDSCGWASVPLSSIVAFLLLGIEEIGVSIEEPFSILPLESICDTIQGNVKELCSVHGTHNGSHSPLQAPAARDVVLLAVAEAEQAAAAAAAATVGGGGATAV
ncbi:hypothetical protein D9Q98_009523 [Chlorella vulgaris]|uniref:Uncharacterized protein n=1 Tax=Chlorella vulgaris TaxID=3077 RepID=A0A9D4YSK0_CHLVU|nr:hypothetical protein D9Q98_009523 [Chlorella vulgaris]